MNIHISVTQRPVYATIPTRFVTKPIVPRYHRNPAVVQKMHKVDDITHNTKTGIVLVAAVGMVTGMWSTTAAMVVGAASLIVVECARVAAINKLNK